MSSAYYQLKLGHGYNKAYLFSQGHSQNKKCECGKRETPEHLLLSCSNYWHKRKELREKLNGNNLTLKLLLNARIGIEKTIDFIESPRISTRKWHLERKKQSSGQQ